MMFPYKYVQHKMDRMQRFTNFIFYQVWCRAYKLGDFRLELFDANPDLKDVMETFYYSDTKGADFFYGHIERIYGMFANLSRTEIKQFKRWYQGNNNIEKVCDNDPAIDLARYADIPLKHSDLRVQLASFYGALYDNVDIAALKKKIGEIDDHYKSFMKENTVGKCPFCGISDVLDANHKPREAYDHYLPKKLYPFNSINFRNLVPACHHCNSSYKTTKDPAFTPNDPARATHRRKFFYPFANFKYSIEVSVILSKPDIEHLTTSDIRLSFGPAVLNEQIETWKNVYGIEERYKAKCCSADAKDWVEQIRIFRDKHGLTPEELLIDLQEQTDIDPFANSNFLKKAFLDGCQKIGLFD